MRGRRVLVDYHTHTRATADGKATLLEMAEAAAARGIVEMAVTDHFVYGIDFYCVSVKELEQHARDAVTARERFGITVRVGAEVDLFPSARQDVERFLNSFPFDFLIGAGHFVDGAGLADEGSARRYFEGKDLRKCYRDYFAMLCDVAMSGLFDVLAHPDIVRKFGDRFLGPLPFDAYAEDAAALTSALKKSGTGFEVNCRGYDHAPKDAYPSEPLLKLFANAGIRPVTVGSDAHDTATAGLLIGRGLDRLRAAGYDSVDTFSQRTATPVPI